MVTKSGIYCVNVKLETAIANKKMTFLSSQFF